MTRFERWRSMTDEEILYLIMNPYVFDMESEKFCRNCKLTDYELHMDDDRACRECAIKWLKEEA